MLTAKTVLPAVPAVSLTLTGKAEEDVPKLLDALKVQQQATAQLRQILQTVLDNVHADLSLGKEMHEVTAAAPTVVNLDRGVLHLRKDGATYRLYTRMDDVMYYADLTAV